MLRSWIILPVSDRILNLLLPIIFDGRWPWDFAASGVRHTGNDAECVTVTMLVHPASFNGMVDSMSSETS